MALLGTYIDSRTLSGLATAGTVTYAHGLSAAPDFVLIQFVATIATSTNHYTLNALSDATNVTIQNSGNRTSPDFRAIAVQAHSIIR